MFSHNGANGPVRQVAAPGRSLPSPTASCSIFNLMGLLSTKLI